MRRRFSVALVVGGLSAVLAVLTLITREWIEIVCGIDPDGGNGAMEWTVVVASSMTAILCLGYGRIEWQRTQLGEGAGCG